MSHDSSLGPTCSAGTAQEKKAGVGLPHICDHKKRPFAGIDIASSLSELVRKSFILY